MGDTELVEKKKMASSLSNSPCFGPESTNVKTTHVSRGPVHKGKRL